MHESGSIKVMSFNIYGHATMPQAANEYAELIKSRNVDVVGIQEGVDDWMIGNILPTDYSRANTLAGALGECWDQRYQIFINVCQGNTFVSNRRYDMTDGPNAARTGESALIDKDGFQYAVVNIHWDHQSGTTKLANARETAAEINTYADVPVVLTGDFNTGCSSSETNTMVAESGIALIGDAGIDCIFARDLTGSSQRFSGGSSDHPGLDADLSNE